MKVLFIATSAYIPDDKRKTVTGYDYIVSEIAQKLSEKCDIDLYLLRPYPRNCKVNTVSIIGHSYKDLLKYFRLSDISAYLKIAFKEKTDIKSRIRNVSYYLVMRDIEQLILLLIEMYRFLASIIETQYHLVVTLGLSIVDTILLATLYANEA